MRFIECQIFLTRFFLLAAICGVLFILPSCSSHSKDTYLQKGEEYLQKRKFHDAMMQFRAAADIDKDSAAAQWGLARSYENLGQFNETIDALRLVVDLSPENLDAKVKLGNYFLLVQPPLIPEAEKVAADIAERDPNYIEGHIFKASILAAQNKPEKDVVDLLNKAIAMDTARVESYLSLSRYYMTVNKAPESEEVIKKGIAARTNAALGYMEYGRFLTYTSRSPEAEAQFKKAIEVEPANIEAREVIADYYVGERRFDNAEQSYKDLVAMQENSPEAQVQLGDFYAQINRSDDAIAVFSSIITASPEYARARYRLGEVYLGRKEFAKVYEQLEVLLAANDDDTEALMLRARVQMQENKTEAAIKDLEDILKKHPSHRDALYFMVQSQLSLGKIDQAKAFMGDIERYHPTYLKARLLKVQITMNSGETESALKQATELYEMAKNSFPNAEMTAQGLLSTRINALTARGTAYLTLRKTAEAKADMEEALKLSPKSAPAMVNLAQIYIAERNLAEASNLYEKALAADGKSFDALSGIVSIHNRQKQFAEAHARVDKTLQANEGSKDIAPALHYLKADVYTAERNLGAAETELQKAIGIDEDYFPAYSAYATLLVAQNRTDTAIEQYKKIVDKRPSAVVYTLLGMLQDASGNKSQAEADYRRALEITPETAIAANNLAWLLAENQGNLDEALQLAQTTANKNPTVAGYYDTLGYVYFKKGFYTPAIEQFKKAVALDESQAQKTGKGINPGYRSRLGMAMNSAGERASL